MHSEILIREYLDRRRKNPAYSERAFARTTGLSAGFLKLLFQGKRNLSASRAREIGRRLGWSERETETFIGKKPVGGPALPQETYFEISDWFHFAIVEAIKTSHGPVTASGLARRLGISVTESAYSLAKLEEAGLLERSGKGRYRARAEYEAPPISHESIRKYHRQTLAKAIEAVDGQTSEQRELRGLTLAFDPSRINEARALIQKFMKTFERKFNSGNQTAVYQLNLALMQLDQNPEGK